MKCSWCGEKEADGVAVGTAKPIYCKECQLALLKECGMGTKALNQLLDKLFKERENSNDSQKRQINNADKS